jgi:hypothetical protein
MPKGVLYQGVLEKCYCDGDCNGNCGGIANERGRGPPLTQKIVRQIICSGNYVCILLGENMVNIYKCVDSEWTVYAANICAESHNTVNCISFSPDGTKLMCVPWRQHHFLKFDVINKKVYIRFSDYTSIGNHMIIGTPLCITSSQKYYCVGYDTSYIALLNVNIDSPVLRKIKHITKLIKKSPSTTQEERTIKIRQIEVSDDNETIACSTMNLIFILDTKLKVIQKINIEPYITINIWKTIPLRFMYIRNSILYCYFEDKIVIYKLGMENPLSIEPTDKNQLNYIERKPSSHGFVPRLNRCGELKVIKQILPCFKPERECFKYLRLEAKTVISTIMLIDWRLQWQIDTKLVSEETHKAITTQVELSTLPTEIWFVILSFCFLN